MTEPSTLQDLLDLEELRRLKARYLLAVDGRDWQELRSLFLEDAPVEIDGAHYDLDGFMEVVTTGMAEHVAVHRGHMPLIDLLGNQEARGIWTMSSVVIGATQNVRESGYYHETYRKLDALGWRIASMIITHTIVRQESS